MKFIDAIKSAVSREASDAELEVLFDCAVDEWHDSKEDFIDIHACLGVTFNEYASIIEKGTPAIRAVAESRLGWYGKSVNPRVHRDNFVGRSKVPIH